MYKSLTIEILLILNENKTFVKVINKKIVLNVVFLISDLVLDEWHFHFSWAWYAADDVNFDILTMTCYANQHLKKTEKYTVFQRDLLD